MYKLVIGKALTPWENSLVFFDIFRNFGVFLGFFVVFSLIYFFYKNWKNYIFIIWFIIPLVVLVALKNSDPRYGFILMPIYAMSCGFTFTEIGKKIRRSKKAIFVLFIFSLIILQIINNSLINSQGPNYPADEIMKSTKKDGNILILSEDPVYSSVFMFYGRVNKVPGNMVRPCILFQNKLTVDFLRQWGIRYIIDQENVLNESLIKSLNLTIVLEKNVDKISLRLFEVHGEISSTDCNFVCILMGKVCKNENFLEIIPLINKNIYTQ
jgi:hypothetical protein